jgi:5-methyltetrahydropteroyltriglutamate--homocysteine methyltransferase
MAVFAFTAHIQSIEPGVKSGSVAHMKRSEHRILTTHVGSLIRPKALVDAARDPDPAHADAHEQELTHAVAEVVARQAQAGIDIVNDGEFGKSGWANYSLERLSGFEPRPDTRYEAVWLGRDRFRFAEFMAAEFPRGTIGTPGHACSDAIVYHGHAAVRRDLKNLKAAAAAANVEDMFFTAVAPASVGYDAANEHYASERDYVFAIAEAMREEYLEVVKTGVVLQVDDAVLANMYDHLVAQSPQKYREWAELRIAALNHALSGIPEDRVRYHVCFGSWHVPHVADAQLEDIVDLILKVNAGAYSIEAANARHEHEWYVWEKVKLPPGKMLIPGVVTHHTTTVEHPRLVAERIITFAKLIGRENVIAGTDCGFAQAQDMQRVHPQVMWAKLEALAEGARLASKELWGR